jgi:hypothetical protein
MAKSTSIADGEWSNGVPVSGDTITAASGAAPTGENIPGAGSVSWSMSDEMGDPVPHAEDYMGSLSLAYITLLAGSYLAIGSDFIQANVGVDDAGEADNRLYIYDDATCTVDTNEVALEYGGKLIVEAGATLTSMVATGPNIGGTVTVDGAIVGKFATTAGGTMALEIGAAGKVTMLAGSSLAGTLTVTCADGGQLVLGEGSIAGGFTMPALTVTALTLVATAGAILGNGAHSYGRMIVQGDVTFLNATLTLASGMIEGGGAVTSAGITLTGIGAAEGVRDGGGISGVTFQYGKSGTAAHTGTAA